MRALAFLVLMLAVSVAPADSAWDSSYSAYFDILLMVGDDVVGAVPTLAAIDAGEADGIVRFQNLFVFSDTFLAWLSGESTVEVQSIELIIQPDPTQTPPLTVVLSGCRAGDFQQLESEGSREFPGVVRCGVTVEHNLEELKLPSS